MLITTRTNMIGWLVCGV